jgi:uncharacterized repeat protein (TIGR01451 family)
MGQTGNPFFLSKITNALSGPRTPKEYSLADDCQDWLFARGWGCKEMAKKIGSIPLQQGREQMLRRIIPRFLKSALFIGLFVHFLLLGKAYGQFCYPPYSEQGDYENKGSIYIGADWSGPNGEENYLTIANASAVRFKDVNLTFQYGQVNSIGFCPFSPYYCPDGVIYRERTFCAGSYSEFTAMAGFVLEDPKSVPFPDLGCPSQSVSSTQDIPMGETRTINFPEGYISTHDVNFTYRLKGESNCCSQLDERGYCIASYKEFHDETITQAFGVAACELYDVRVTGENIIIGGWHDCEYFSFQCDMTTCDRGKQYAVYVKRPHVHVKIVPSVQRAKPRDMYTYRVEYENASEETYNNVLLVAYIPGGTAYVNGSASYAGFNPPSYNAGLNRLEWSLGSVKPWKKGTAVFQVQVDSCIPEGAKEIAAKAQILVSGAVHDEHLSDPVTLEAFLLTKEVQEKRAYKNDLLHYTLRIKNLSDCDESPLFTLEDPIDPAVNFVSTDKIGSELVDGTVRWQSVSLPESGEEEIHMVWQVKEDLQFQGPEVINGFAAKFSTGKDILSNSCSTFIGEGIYVLLELKNYNEGGNPGVATYDTNVAVLTGRILANPPPEDPTAFYSGLTVEPGSKPIVGYNNQSGRNIDALISDLKSKGLLTDADVVFPTLVINPGDGTLQLEDGTTEIPIKLLDETNNITVRVKDPNGTYAEATVTAKSVFQEKRHGCLTLLDNLKAKEVDAYYGESREFFNTLYAGFVRVGEEEAKSLTEVAYRMYFVEDLTLDAAEISWNVINESIKIEDDIATAGDVSEAAALFYEKALKRLFESKLGKKISKACLEKLEPIGDIIDRKIFEKLDFKSGVYPMDTVFVEWYLDFEVPVKVFVEKTGEFGKAVLALMGKKGTERQQWLEDFMRGLKDDFHLRFFSAQKGFYLYMLSRLVFDAHNAYDGVLNWQGNRKGAEYNHESAKAKLRNQRVEFEIVETGFDGAAEGARKVNEWADGIGLIPHKYADSVSKIWTGFSVAVRNGTRIVEGSIIANKLRFLLKLLDGGIYWVIHSTEQIDPKDPTPILQDSITPLLDQLEMAVNNNDETSVSIIFENLANEFDDAAVWEKEIQVKGTYAAPWAGMNFMELALGYERFLNSSIIASGDRAALGAAVLAYMLNTTDTTIRQTLSAAISAARTSQANLQTAAENIVPLLNNSRVPAMAAITKIRSPLRKEIGTPFTMTVDVKNIGEEEVRGLKVSIKYLPQGFSASSIEREVGDLLPGGSKTVTFDLVGSEYVVAPRAITFNLIGQENGFLRVYDTDFVQLSTEKASAEQIVGIGGGTLSTPDGQATVTIQPGTVSDNTTFLIVPVSHIFNPGEGFKNVGGYFDLAALDQGDNSVGSFAKPLEVTLRYQDGDLNGVDKGTLQIWYLDESSSTWAAVPSFNDPSSNKVIGYTSHLSTFALFPGTPNADTDSDGIPDWWEAKNGLDPNNPLDASQDSDHDGLTNLQEYQRGTDPNNGDTDGDGIADGYMVPIVDLAAFKASASSVSLTFTSPAIGGANGAVKATGYDLRYSKEAITESNWGFATEAWGEQQPLSVGSQEAITVRGLDGNSSYYFAIKGVDSSGRVSTLSNVITANTACGVDWTRDENPALPPGETDAFDSTGAYHPSVIYDVTDPAYPAGIYKMWYSGSTGSGQDERYRIGYAISEDGVRWTKVPGTGAGGSVIDVSVVAGFEESMIGTPSVIKDEVADPGARYKLWYYQLSGNGEPFSNAIIYCTSPDGINWTKQGIAFGRSGVEGRFDRDQAYFPTILEDDSEADPNAHYKMWYTGFVNSGEYGIGYAVSADGVNWTKVDGPNADKSVMTNGVPGDFDENRVLTPSVIKKGGVYIMFYSGAGPRSYAPAGPRGGGLVRTIGYATSRDGIHWNKVKSSGPGDCSLDAGPSGHFDEEGVLTPSVIRNGTHFEMWYGGTARDGKRRIGHATSNPGRIVTGKRAESVDFDGDGKADVLWQHTGGTVAMWLMNGTSVSSVGVPGSASTDWQIKGAADFDGDGKTDVLWQHAPSGTVALWLMNGSTISSDGVPGTVSNNWQIKGAGDFDGDGKADILWQDGTTGTVAIWFMNGTAIGSVGISGEVGSDWQIKGVGDFDGSGKACILWQSTTTGTAAIWIMDGSNITSAGIPGAAGPDWQIKGVGDFDGDGKADILWQDNVTGTVALWFMNGTSISSVGVSGTISSNWQLKGVGDFDGDGKADILWQDNVTGTVVVWLLDGAAITSVGVSEAVDSGWQIIE